MYIENKKNLFLLYSTKIPDLVDTHLAILKPKPHLYTFFTYKNQSYGQSFTAGNAHRGTACFGHLAELYGNKIDSYYHKESLRTSINMYASVSEDLDFAQVGIFVIYYVQLVYEIILEYTDFNICRLLLMNLAII